MKNTTYDTFVLLVVHIYYPISRGFRQENNDCFQIEICMEDYFWGTEKPPDPKTRRFPTRYWLLPVNSEYDTSIISQVYKNDKSIILFPAARYHQQCGTDSLIIPIRCLQ